MTTPTVVRVPHYSELPGNSKDPKPPVELAVKSPVELAAVEGPITLNRAEEISRRG